MAVTIGDMLQPQVILDVVSRIRKGQGRLGNWFGFHYTRQDEESGALTGPNTRESPARHGSYRIFDRTRTIAQGRAPGTGPATWSPQPVGEVNYTCARFHEKIRLDYEQLGNMSRVMGPNAAIDKGGQDYLSRQEKYLVTRFSNAIELMTAGMIRGTWYLAKDDESYYPTLTAPAAANGAVTIDHQIPAGNKGQLNMLGAGAIIGTSWANAAAPIISNDLPKISQAFAQLHGYRLADAWCDSVTWGKIMLNTEVINSAGSASRVFDEFDYVGERGNDGKGLTEKVAVLRGYPSVRWHILDDVLVADGGTDPSYSAGTGTLTPVIPANCVSFQPEVDDEWVDFLHCGEFVADNVAAQAVMRHGFYFWHEMSTQPTAIELIGLFNGIPRLSIPKALALATVIF